MKLTSGSAARRKKVVVVGAGIGGLTAAVALHRSGHEVQVFERARQLGEVGAGLQLGPNAVRIVEALGLGQELHRLAAEPTERVSLKWDTGEQRVREPYKGVMRQRFGAPYLMAHRADVHNLLMRQLPDGCIRTGAECVEVVTSPASASARFADGSAVEADVVVGADGIHSMVRNSLFDPVRPRFTQQICWRVVLPMDAIRRAPALPLPLTGMEYTGWLGPTGHVLFYPLRGGELLNIFAGRVSSDWVGESWTVDSSVPEMLQAYAGWNDGMLEVLSQATSAYCWGIHDRDPLANWTKGRVTLLGDAAHPMMPTLAQGAAISMEDGACLARHLAAHDVDTALGLYESERRPRASRVQLQARQQFLNNQMTPPPPPLPTDWIYGHDAVNGTDFKATA